MREQLQRLVEARVRQCVTDERGERHCEKIERKKECHAKRAAEIVKVRAVGKITGTEAQQEQTATLYHVHFQYLIKQKGILYMEEEVEERKAIFKEGKLVDDLLVEPEYNPPTKTDLPHHLGTDFRTDLVGGMSRPPQQNEPFITIRATGDTQPSQSELSFSNETQGNLCDSGMRLEYRYNRLRAVQYAERWWNTHNPAYKKFENDCTNFISQCLHQGGGPMRGYPNRRTGWWMKGQNYSYSWAMAHALKTYLANSKTGIRAREVSRPDQLLMGDVICYDFQGDGRFDHNTIVTGKDADGMPLVNAHTYNSRQRYWAYEDSSAYTPNIKYKFLSIVDDG